MEEHRMEPSSARPLTNKACVECSRSKTRCVQQGLGSCRRCTRRETICLYKTRGPMGRPKHDTDGEGIDLARVIMRDVHSSQNNNETEVGQIYSSKRADHDSPMEDVPSFTSLLPHSQDNYDSAPPNHYDPELRMALEQDWPSQVLRNSSNGAANLSCEQTIDRQLRPSEEHRGLTNDHFNWNFRDTHTCTSRDPVSRPQYSSHGSSTSLNSSVTQGGSQGSFHRGFEDSPATAANYIPQLEPPLLPDLQGPMNPFSSTQQTVVRPERSDQVEPLIRLLFRLQRWSLTWPPVFKGNETESSYFWMTPETISLFKASYSFIRILQGRDISQLSPTKGNVGIIYDVGAIEQSGSMQSLGPNRTWSSSLPNPRVHPFQTPRDRLVVSLIRDCYDYLVYMFDILMAPILQHCQQMQVHSDVSNGSGSSIRLHSTLTLSDLTAVERVASIFEQIDRAIYEGSARLSPVEPSAQFSQPTYNHSQSGRSAYPRCSSGGMSLEGGSAIATQPSIAFHTLKTDQNNSLDELKSLDLSFRANLAGLRRLLRQTK